MGIDPQESRLFSQLDPEKRKRILEAAIREFAEKGYNNASMNMVVQKAGISKGALFKYFHSKSGLFAFVYRMALNLVKDYLRNVRDTSKGEDFFRRLERVMQAGTNFIRSYPGLAQIYYRITYTGDSPHKKEMLGELHRESLKFIQSLIEQGIQRKELHPSLNPQTAAFVLQCFLDRFLQAHHLQFLDHSLNLYEASEAESNRWIQEVIEIFKKGMENHPELAF